MDRQTQDTIKSILNRLDDAKREVNSIRLKEEYPLSAKFERAYDYLESAEKYLRETISND